MKLGSGQRSAIESALLDFHRSPGKYPLIRKQPQLLFLWVKEVLQLASGRSPDGDEATGPSVAVRQAASFFIRSALLYPDADHYALLGLEHSADAATVKDRYRLMMRLMHPDFATSLAGTGWPADAASRVNQAYEVLASPVQRRRYDEQLDPPASPRPPKSDARSVAVKVAPPQVQAVQARRSLKQLAMVFGTVGGIAVLASLFADLAADKESLVQRAPIAAASTPRPVAVIATRPVVVLPEAESAKSPIEMAVTLPVAPVAVAAEMVTAQVPPAAVQSAPVFVKPIQRMETVYPTRSAPMAMLVTMTSSAPALTPPPQYVLQVMPVPAQVIPEPAPTAPGAPALNPGFSAIDAHLLMSKLLQQLESGWGDQVLGLLERDARRAPAAQAFVLHYNNLVEGIRPVTLSLVQFKSEPREGKLLVTGRVLIHHRNQPAGTPDKELALQVEFAQRDGNVVMTGLARAQE